MPRCLTGRWVVGGLLLAWRAGGEQAEGSSGFSGAMSKLWTQRRRLGWSQGGGRCQGHGELKPQGWEKREKRAKARFI